MALTPSNMLDLGIKAPDFDLPAVNMDKHVNFQDVKGETGTIVMFICNHCPYVIHVFQEIVRLANDYQKKGIGFVAISSNDVENYEEDSPDKMAIVSKVLQFTFPYCYDESQDVAKAYDAACTPDFYLFDQNNNLAYRGRLDASRPGMDVPVTGEDLRAAIDTVLSGETVSADQYPSMGCNIKWKK